MNSADRERVKELLARASRVPPGDRAAFIRQATGADHHIAAEVIDLLATLDDPQFMSAPTGVGLAAALTGTALPGEGPGTRIDRYKLLQLIGEGGFGSVFLAEQTEPVQRRVALKIIKAGMDTKQVIARFDAERQAVALMDHPNIARVFDAGATESGRPYFVMELVRGEPVTRYCDRERLSVRQRLVLFREICHAVQHAHQKGTIHRDLKPSNVLVTVADGEPIPKVIDFGIAKATATQLTDKTLFTELHQLIGTPEYMSPEQAETSSMDIDTRSDVYSLGVLLYELLSGSTPIERGRLRSTSLAEIQRLIREEEPPRPSLRLATRASSAMTDFRSSDRVRDHAGSSIQDIAHDRRAEPSALLKALRGDLDWIVMKCLEKDRRRRYATASALADDVGRFLSDMPVLATPPGRIYTARKFIRRHKRTAVASAAILATLLVAASVSLLFGLAEARQRRTAEAALVRAESAESEAKTRARELEQVARFQQEQLAGIDVQAMGLLLRADLMAQARAVAERSNLPAEEIEARMANLEVLLADADFTGLALDSLEENVFQPALTAIDQQFADQPLVQAQLLHTLAATRFDLGLLESAVGPQQRALEIRRQALGDEHLDTLKSITDMGLLNLARGDLEEAEACLQLVAQQCFRARGANDVETLRAISNLGHLFQVQGKLDEAEANYRKAAEGLSRVLGKEHANTLTAISNLGMFLQEQGRSEEAEPFLSEAFEIRRRVLGEQHRDTLLSMNNLAVLLQSQGNLPKAEEYFRKSLEQHRRLLGDAHPHTLSAIGNMGYILRSQGKFAEAQAYAEEALSKGRQLLGNDHPNTLTYIHNLGFNLQVQGKFALAEPYCREAMERSRRVLGAQHPETLITINTLATVLLAQGKLADAEPLCREVLDARLQLRGPEHFETLISLVNMGSLLRAQGRPEACVELMSPAESYARHAFIGGHTVRLGRFLTTLGRARAALAEFGPAEGNLLEAATIISEAANATDRDLTEVVSGLVELYSAWHAAQPGSGYDTRAAEWQAQLPSNSDGMP